jgi:chemotaxis protein methyltransferase CheR
MIAFKDFQEAQRLLLLHAGIELNQSKQQMVFNRLSKPVKALKFETISDFLAAAANDQKYTQHFVNALTTNVTSFFREAHHFDILKARLNKQLTAPKVWCAGCSTGQEAYSILIALLDHKSQWISCASPLVLATDLDTQALETAKVGIYSFADMKGISAEQQLKYFDPLANNFYQVKPQLRSLIDFQPLNLVNKNLRCPWPSIDYIFCRNVMIYFGSNIQRDLVSRFSKYLNSDGLLFTGHAEMLLHSDSIFTSIGHTAYAIRKAAI